jgi:hypothetical protein
MQRLLLSVCALLVVSFLPLSAVVVTIGTGTSTNSAYTYPAPYGNWYTMARHQILVLASEIIAAGGSAGSITSLAFNVAATNNTQALQNFTIKLKQTSATSLSSSFDNTGWTTVYSVSSYTVTTGWNTHTFSTPFAWDGSSNLLIDICFYQGSCYNYTYNASTYYTTTAFTSVVYYITTAISESAVYPPEQRARIARTCGWISRRACRTMPGLRESLPRLRPSALGARQSRCF